MHREITYADRAFGEQESRLSLFLLTGLVGVILAADLWPFAAAWLDARGLSLPTWPNEVGGYRIALIAALLGGARILAGSLDSLLQGRLGADLALGIAVVAAILVRESAVAAELVFVGLLGCGADAGTVRTFTMDNVNTSVSTAVTPTPPAAPSGLGASAVSASQINLAWIDGSSNEDGFKI